MDQRLDDSLSGERFRLFLFSAFAVLALVLAAVGVYGVMSYSVRMRMHEIGVRMALGAGAADVLTIILRHALKLAMIGVLAGVGLGLMVTRLMSTLLFGIKPNDSLTFLGASLMSILVIAAASLIPSCRAARTDPLRVLRAE
jgi:ABC-type antimicrobial peptide transport system permease subunit